MFWVASEVQGSLANPRVPAIADSPQFKSRCRICKTGEPVQPPGDRVHRASPDSWALRDCLAIAERRRPQSACSALLATSWPAVEMAPMGTQDKGAAEVGQARAMGGCARDQAAARAGWAAAGDNQGLEELVVAPRLRF